jgi:hypothetical protein
MLNNILNKKNKVYYNIIYLKPRESNTHKKNQTKPNQHPTHHNTNEIYTTKKQKYKKTINKKKNKGYSKHTTHY